MTVEATRRFYNMSDEAEAELLTVGCDVSNAKVKISDWQRMECTRVHDSGCMGGVEGRELRLLTRSQASEDFKGFDDSPFIAWHLHNRSIILPGAWGFWPAPSCIMYPLSTKPSIDPFCSPMPWFRQPSSTVLPWVASRTKTAIRALLQSCVSCITLLCADRSTPSYR